MIPGNEPAQAKDFPEAFKFNAGQEIEMMKIEMKERQFHEVAKEEAISPKNKFI